VPTQYGDTAIITDASARPSKGDVHCVRALRRGSRAASSSRPLWSGALLAELEYTEIPKLMGRCERPDVAAVRARHLIAQMTAVLDDALVENGEPHEGTIGLPGPDDEHRNRFNAGVK
jgi:hypothetical protein